MAPPGLDFDLDVVEREPAFARGDNDLGSLADVPSIGVAQVAALPRVGGLSPPVSMGPISTGITACGFIPQYAGLEALWRRHRDRGLVVLGFPRNQFAGQEPGGAAEIREFCSTRYDVTFPLFAKIDVNGDAAHPVYRHLKSRAPGVLGTEAIKWNFTKFVVDRAGNVVERFAPATTPEALESQLDRWL